MSIEAEVEVKSLPNSDSWREGRRIVNLGVIVVGLKEGRRRCHQLLQLTDYVGQPMLGQLSSQCWPVGDGGGDRKC